MYTNNNLNDKYWAIVGKKCVWTFQGSGLRRSGLSDSRLPESGLPRSYCNATVFGKFAKYRISCGLNANLIRSGSDKALLNYFFGAWKTSYSVLKILSNVIRNTRLFHTPAFWMLTQHKLVHRHRRFGKTYCFHFQILTRCKILLRCQT
jgi:hypothetical protein